MDELSVWKGFESGELAAADVKNFIRENARLGYLTFEINDICNLRCGYCYLGQRPTRSKDSLTTSEWKGVLEQAADLGVSVIGLVGKEPFIDHQGVEVLVELDALKKRGWQGRFGVINNGTLIKRFLPELAGLAIDYLDMSVDGPPEIHDAIRMGGSGKTGAGAWEKTAQAFELITQMPSVKDVTACCVLHSGNFRSIAEHVDCLWQRGVRSFLFGTVDNFYKGYEPDSFELTLEDIVDVYDDIYEVALRYRWQGGQFVLAFDHFFGSRYQDYLLDVGIINPDHIEESDGGAFFTKPAMCEEGLGFFLKLTLFPFSFWKIVRITHDGWLIANHMNLGKPDYQKWSVGNVRNESLQTLFARALESAEFEGFWSEYLTTRHRAVSSKTAP